MKFSVFLLLPFALVVLALCACQKSPPPPDEAAIFNTIQANLHAMKAKNVDAVMATIHPQAVAYESTRELTRLMFDQLDVKYEITDLKLVAATADEAKVSFKQRMEKTGGAGQFTDNIVHGLHILRLDNGQWKIHRTQQLRVTDLAGKPLGAIEPEPLAVAPKMPAAPAATPDPSLPTPLPGKATPPRNAPPLPPTLPGLAPNAPPASPPVPPPLPGAIPPPAGNKLPQ